MAIVDALATRWATGRFGSYEVVWFEIRPRATWLLDDPGAYGRRGAPGARRNAGTSSSGPGRAWAAAGNEPA